MNLNIGDEIEIRGRHCEVCYHTEYDGENFIGVIFDTNNKFEFDIYTYKFEGDKLLVSEITDPDELKPVFEIFLKEDVEAAGLEDEFIKYAEKHEMLNDN